MHEDVSIMFYVKIYISHWNTKYPHVKKKVQSNLFLDFSLCNVFVPFLPHFLVYLGSNSEILFSYGLSFYIMSCVCLSIYQRI